MKKCFISVFSVLFLSLLVSCSDEDIAEGSRMCTVSYDADAGGEVLNTSVAYGKTAPKADWEPSKPGYTFLGWYYTDEFDEEKEYPFTIAVTKDVVLKAKYRGTDSPDVRRSRRRTETQGRCTRKDA